jgi:sulfopyruvate decarboxylase subunit beta
MRRYEALQEIMRVVADELVIVNLGHPAQELFAIRDRPQNFYMLGSMGLCSSIAHGLALAQDKKVIAIDGDASCTMNMGGFATIGHTQPRNLVQIVIDNRANGSTGFQPSFTAGRLKLETVAQAAGIEKISIVDSAAEIGPAVSAALADKVGPHFILIRTEVGMPDAIKVIPLGPLDIKRRFQASIEGASR